MALLDKWIKMFVTDRITLMVVPRANQGIRSYRIPIGIVYGLLLFLLFSVFASGHSVLRTAELSRQRREVTRLTSDNQQLEIEVSSIQMKVDGLTTELAELTRFEERIRVVADLDPIDDDVRLVGIGGPVAGGRRDLIDWRLRNELAGNPADDSQRDVKLLARQSRLLRASFDEVLKSLGERKSELEHTPSIMPVESVNSWMTDRFGYRTDPFTGNRSMHYGLDISARRGEPIVATADGTVSFSGRKGSYGHTVEIDHGGGIVTRYSHATKLFVKRGQKVVRGQVIAAVGSSGRATAAHLHYEVRVNNRCVNPLKYILL